MLSKFHEIADEDYVVHVLRKDEKWCALIENDKRKDTLGVGNSMAEALVDLANKIEDGEYLSHTEAKDTHVPTQKFTKNMAYLIEFISLLGIVTKFLKNRRHR